MNKRVFMKIAPIVAIVTMSSCTKERVIENPVFERGSTTFITRTVELEDGSEAIFTVPSYQTDGMWLGNKVAVEYHEGGLGLEYVSIKGVFDLGPK